MITIFYFSGTGNTWMMAKCIQKELEAKGKEVNCYSIENEKLDKELIHDLLSKTEHLIIGYPIYGSEAPKVMGKFVEELPVLEKNLPVGVFCTQALMSGDGANYLECILKDKNMTLMQTEEFNLSNNFYVPVFVRALPVGDRDKINRRNMKAKKQATVFISSIIENRKYIKSINHFHKWVGNSQRKHMDTYIKKVNDGLYASDKCILCGLCEDLCPVDNIEVKDSVVFSNHCIACMRCYQSCPISAVQITSKSEDMSKYPRYKGPHEKFNFKVVKE